VPARVQDIGQLLQAVESAVQDMVFMGVGIFFLATLESRVKRRRALRQLRELRALAHIVDMHQLTFQLARYLDYSSEMLSLISKLAALYAQRFDDAVILAAVDEVEDLTNGLARKIWQKIMVLQSDVIAESR
jgi:hypothetical protein